MIALLEARKAGLLAKQHWLRNILAGVVVAVVALPLAMAFAIASGAKPEQGLYTAIIAGFLARSEEHTSELQSLMRISYAVFCLKKKNTNTTTTTAHLKHTHHKS